MERQSVELQTKISDVRGKLAESHTKIAGRREKIRNHNDGSATIRRFIVEL